MVLFGRIYPPGDARKVILIFSAKYRIIGQNEYNLFFNPGSEVRKGHRNRPKAGESGVLFILPVISLDIKI